MANIVIVTHWLDGDVVPFVRIGSELKRRGHDVTLVTHCHFAEMAVKAGLDFRAWDTPEEFARLVDQMQENKDDNSFQSNNFSYESNAFRQSTESIEIRLREYRIVDECSQRPDTVFLCKSRSSVATYLVAEKRRLPLATVLVNPSEVASMLIYDELEGKNDLPRLNELREKVGLPPVDSWLQWESSAKMTLALWPEWYDHIDDQWPSKIETVGFPLECGKQAYQREISSEFAEWLEKNPHPILITGGTTKIIDKSFYINSIEACGLLGQPTVLLCQYEEFLPEKLPANVKWYKYIPLDEIMPKLSVLIHHGGVGTVTGGLAAGIPQLILPGYVDRPYNATLIKELGAGDYLLPSNWQPEKIAAMVKTLQSERTVESCHRYVSKMMDNRGVTVVADRVEQMIDDTDFVYSINRDYDKKLEPREAKAPEVKRSVDGKLLKLSAEQRARILSSLKKKSDEQRELEQYEKKAYMTIDDGPSVARKEKVDILNQYGIQAVWFCEGRNMEVRPDDVLYTISKGHIIGNHAFSHSHFSEMTLEQCKKEILDTDQMIDRLYDRAGVKRPIKLFRFPYGDEGVTRGFYDVNYTDEEKKRVDSIQTFLKELGYVNFPFEKITYKYFDGFRKSGRIDWLWTYDAMEWCIDQEKPQFEVRTVDDVLEMMELDLPERWMGLSYPESDEIIVVHDHPQTSDIFGTIIKGFIDRGIRFGSFNDFIAK